MKASVKVFALLGALIVAVFLFIEGSNSQRLITGSNESKAQKSVEKITVVSGWNDLRADPTNPIHRAIFGPISQIQRGLVEAMNDGRISSNDLEKLDFNWPGAPDFNQNPDHEVFNKRSRQSIIGNEKIEIDIDAAKSLQLKFMVRRVTAQKTKHLFDTLYAVIPNVQIADCQRMVPPEHKVFQDIDQMPSNNFEVVEDTQTLLFKCVREKTGELSFPVPVFARRKAIDSDVWLP